MLTKAERSSELLNEHLSCLRESSGDGGRGGDQQMNLQDMGCPVPTNPLSYCQCQDILVHRVSRSRGGNGSKFMTTDLKI